MSASRRIPIHSLKNGFRRDRVRKSGRVPFGTKSPEPVRRLAGAAAARISDNSGAGGCPSEGLLASACPSQELRAEPLSVSPADQCHCPHK